MKRLILLRHAKAVPHDASADHARDLNERGRKAAREAGQALVARGWRPDVALVSDAVRTRATFEHAAPAFVPAPVLRLAPSLYEASTAAVLAAIAATPDDCGTLLVVGHNPSIGDLARRLARSGDAAGRARMAEGFPTAAAALLSVAADRWADLPGRDTALDALLLPDR